MLRAKSNTKFCRTYSYLVVRSKCVLCDQPIIFIGLKSPNRYTECLRRIKFHNQERHKTLVLLTNNTELPMLIIMELCRICCKIELFPKWVKQFLPLNCSSGSVKMQSEANFGLRFPFYAGCDYHITVESECESPHKFVIIEPDYI